jgi:hypothetical protein
MSEPSTCYRVGDEHPNRRQVGGDHYQQLAIQPWDAMAAWMTPEQFAGFLRGNIIKYIARNKGGLEDLQKAMHYLDKLISVQSATEQTELPQIRLTAVDDLLDAALDTIRQKLRALNALIDDHK